MAEAQLTPLAGGTDIYPALTTGFRPVKLLDLSQIVSFPRQVELDENIWRISPLVTWSDIVAADLPRQFDGLKICAREVGGRQIQNRATVIGNICNASPAADGIVALMSMDARLRLVSSRAERVISLGDFVLGNRRTMRGPDELVMEVQIPNRGGAVASSFTKLGSRRYLVISIVMAGVTLEVDETHHMTDVAITVGACSPKAMRLGDLEKLLRGKPVDTDWEPLISEYDFFELSPIDDVRGSAAYRKSVVGKLVLDAMETCRGNLKGGVR